MLHNKKNSGTFKHFCHISGRVKGIDNLRLIYIPTDEAEFGIIKSEQVRP